MAGARALWRATRLTDDDFDRPIVAVANSYTQFVPGPVHLQAVADVVSAAVREAGGVPREFNTISVDAGDTVTLDIPGRGIHLDVGELDGYRPRARQRPVSAAQHACASRDVSQVAR